MPRPKPLVVFLFLAATLSSLFLVTKLTKKPRSSDTRTRAAEDKIGLLNSQIIQDVTAEGTPTSEIEVKIRERKLLLLAELERSPKEFLGHVLPANIRERLSFGSDLLEKEIDTQGKYYLASVDDFEGKTARLLYFLEAKEKTYQLHFAKNQPQFPSGSEIKAHALELNGHLVLASGEPSETVSQDYRLAIVSPPVESPTTGEQKTLLVLINFSNDQSQPITKEQVRQIMFTNADHTSVNDYYVENSFNQINFTGEVYGWYTYPYSYPCQINEWANFADQSVFQDQGVDPSQFQKKIYLFPNNSGGCLAGGLGYIGGPRAWVFYPEYKYIYAHELGHNLGLPHANSLSCGSRIIDDYANCTIRVYGDPTDVMGLSRLHHFSAPHKNRVAWLLPENLYSVQENGTTRFTLYHLENRSSLTQALAFPKLDTNELYYISYRQPLGFDADLSPGLTGGVSIQIYSPDLSQDTRILDSHPETPNNFQDAALNDAQTFSDENNAIRLTQISHDSVKTVVELDYQGFPLQSSLIDTWSTTAAYPTAVLNHALVGLNGYLYGLGGGLGLPSANVYRAKIQTDGNLEPWATLTENSLPNPLIRMPAVTYQNFLYLLGGDGEGSVFTSTSSADGTLSPWVRLGNLPQPLFEHAAATYQGKVFVSGGYHASTGDRQNKVYMSSIGLDGQLSSWQEVTSLPTALRYHFMVASENGYLFAGGGAEGSVASSKVCFAKINPEGTLSAWQRAFSLPQLRVEPVAVFQRGRILILGGKNETYANSPVSKLVYAAEVNPDGTLKRWTKDTDLLTALTSHAGTLANGFLYLTGGLDGDQNYSAATYKATFSLPPNNPPQTVSISPNSGWEKPGIWKTFTLTFADQDGVQDLREVELIIRNPENQAQDFRLRYNAATNKVQAYNQATGTWLPENGLVLGSGEILANPHGSANLTNPPSLAGNEMTLTLPLLFTFRKSGTRNNLLMKATDKRGDSSSENNLGTWIINRIPSLITPEISGQTITTSTRNLVNPQYKDLDGHGNLNTLYLLLGSPTDINHSVYLRYDNQTDKMYLYGKNASGNWTFLPPEGVTPRTTFTLENDFVKVIGPATRVNTPDTKTHMVRWSLEFKPAFTGRKAIYMQAEDIFGDIAGGNTGLKWKGYLIIR